MTMGPKPQTKGIRLSLWPQALAVIPPNSCSRRSFEVAAIQAQTGRQAEASSRSSFIDCVGDRGLRAVLIGMLRETDR